MTRVGEIVLYPLATADLAVFNIRSSNPALAVSEGFLCPALVLGFNTDGGANLAVFAGFPPDSVPTNIFRSGVEPLYVSGIVKGDVPGTWQKV